MTLGQKQRLFARLLAEHVLWLYAQGYEVSYGDFFRDPRVFGLVGEFKGYGRSRSNHKRRLAADLNLFKNGEFLDSTEDHAESGKMWESRHEFCRWGGRFSDGNHYSFDHNGQQ